MIRVVTPMIGNGGQRNGNLDEYIYTYMGGDRFKVDFYHICVHGGEQYVGTHTESTHDAINRFVSEELYRYCNSFQKSLLTYFDSRDSFGLISFNGTKEEQDLCDSIINAFSTAKTIIADAEKKFKNQDSIYEGALHEPYEVRISEFLKAVMEDNNITVDELAAKSNLNHKVIDELLEDKAPVTDFIANALEVATDVPKDNWIMIDQGQKEYEKWAKKHKKVCKQ